MRPINVLNIQRISAQDRAKIEAVGPAIRLTDAGGWFAGEIRETWPALPRRAIWRRARWAAEPARIATACSPTLKSSLAAGRFRSICGRGRRGSNGFINARPAPAICCAAICGAATSRSRPRAASAARSPWPNTRWPAFSTSPRTCATPGTIVRLASSTIAPIDRCCCRARPPASSAPAASDSKSAGCAPHSVCGSSAPAATRNRASPCRLGSANSAAPAISRGFCRRAISS